MALGNVHLTPQLVQAVRDAVDVVELAGEHTKLTKAGKRYKGLCPLHKEKTPSFSVDPVQGLFYCFGCSRGGDAIRLHQMLTGDDFPAAIESLARRYGIPLPRRAARGGEGDKERDLETVLEKAGEFFSASLAKAAGPQQYLAERKISPELIARFGLGYAPPGWRNLLGELRDSIPVADLEAAGLVARSEKRGGEPYDRFRNRLMFPIRQASGRLVGFGGRTLGDDQAKYLNTAETRAFRKGTLLYGLDLARRTIRDSGSAFLVEGYFDVLGAVAAGLEGAVASMGTALTDDQARLLSRYANEVVVGYDCDKAGERAFRRILPTLLAQGLGVRRPDLGAGHDPDSLRLEKGADALLQTVEDAPDAVLAELDRLIPSEVYRDPRARAQAASAVVELLKPIPDSILRYGYGQRAADRLRVPVDLLWRRVSPGQRPGERSRNGAEGDASRARLVVNVEQRALQLMLRADSELPPVETLPAPEVFFDPVCRNIFGVFCALYRDEGPKPPDARRVRAALGDEGETIDVLARLLLEGAAAAKAEELLTCFDQLTRRWRQQRLRELSAELAEAQQRGDRERLEELLNEKTTLSSLLHETGGEQ